MLILTYNNSSILTEIEARTDTERHTESVRSFQLVKNICVTNQIENFELILRALSNYIKL